MNALPGYDTWKTAAPDDDGPEPSEAHFDEAFGDLVQDDDLLNKFMLETDVTIATVYQLFHRHGFPDKDCSERDDNLIDSYNVTFTIFFDHYRDWLGSRLTVKAQQVMDAEIEQSRIDAAEYAAECREDAWS